MKRRNQLIYNLLFVLSLSFFVGCENDESVEPTQNEPWKSGVIFGNSAINSKEIVTNEEVKETTYHKHFVYRSELPNAQFEYYSVFIYLPTDPDNFTTKVSSAGAHIYYGGSKVSLPSDNASDFVAFDEFFGNTYSVYRILVRDPNRKANNVSFEKIVWAFDVTYKNRDTEIEEYSSLVWLHL